MAFIVGYVTKAERAELLARGWDVEDADSYPGLVGKPNEFTLMEKPTAADQAVVVWVDTDVIQVMSGPDWETGHLDKKRKLKRKLKPVAKSKSVFCDACGCVVGILDKDDRRRCRCTDPTTKKLKPHPNLTKKRMAWSAGKMRKV